MNLALDVHYRNETAHAVGVLFEWGDTEPQTVIRKTIHPIQPYQSGEFYKRELPCLMAIIETIQLQDLETIIVDGCVYVDNERKRGLGAYLYEATGEMCPVIGVAKNFLKGTEEVQSPVKRGKSDKPLWISSIGTPLNDARSKIEQMKGDYRFPTILKTLDQLSRS